MPRPEANSDVTVPQTAIETLSLFEGRSAAVHVAVALVAGLGWMGGYRAAGGSGTVLAFASGGIVCGLVLGVAFTRGLGGPGLNVVLSFVWPFLLGGGVAVVGDLPYDRLATLSVGVALVFPTFFATLGCLLVWFTVLGPEGVDDWSRDHLPPAFLRPVGE